MTVIPYEDFQIEERVLNRLKEAYAERKINEYINKYGTLPSSGTVQEFYNVPNELMEQYKKYFYSQYLSGKNPYKGNSLVSFSFSLLNEQKGLSYGVPSILSLSSHTVGAMSIYSSITHTDNTQEVNRIDIKDFINNECILRNGKYVVDWANIHGRITSAITHESYVSSYPQLFSISGQTLKVSEDGQILDVSFVEQASSLIVSNEPFDLELLCWPGDERGEIDGIVHSVRFNDDCHYLYLYDYLYDYGLTPNTFANWLGMIGSVNISTHGKILRFQPGDRTLYIHIENNDAIYYEDNGEQKTLNLFLIQNTVSGCYQTDISYQSNTAISRESTTLVYQIYSSDRELSFEYEDNTKPEWINGVYINDFDEFGDHKLFSITVMIDRNETGIRRETTITIKNSNNDMLPISITQLF